MLEAYPDIASFSLRPVTENNTVHRVKAARLL